MLEQLLRIQIDGHEPVWPTVRIGKFRPFDIRQARANKIRSQILHLLKGKVLAAKPDLQHGDVRSAVNQHERRLRPRGHAANRNLRLRGDFSHGARDVGTRLKEKLDHREPMVTLRFHVLDVVYGLR